MVERHLTSKAINISLLLLEIIIRNLFYYIFKRRLLFLIELYLIISIDNEY